MSVDLFDLAEKQSSAAGARQGRPVARLVDDMVEYLSGSEQIAELLENEALRQVPAEAAGWLERGHRSFTVEEDPWMIDGLIGKEITEPHFRRMVRARLARDNIGTSLYSLVQREHNGDWQLAKVAVSYGKPADVTVRNDERRKGRPEGVTGDDGGVVLMNEANSEEFTAVRKRVVRWVVQYVDARNSPWIERDHHGREKGVRQDVVPDWVKATVRDAVKEASVAAAGEAQARDGAIVDVLQRMAAKLDGEAPEPVVASEAKPRAPRVDGRTGRWQKQKAAKQAAEALAKKPLSTE